MFAEHDTLRVLSQAVYDGWASGTVQDHMTTEAQTISSDACIRVRLGIQIEREIRMR